MSDFLWKPEWTVTFIDAPAGTITYSLTDALYVFPIPTEKSWAGFADYMHGRIDEGGWPTRDAAGEV